VLGSKILRLLLSSGLLTKDIKMISPKQEIHMNCKICHDSQNFKKTGSVSAFEVPQILDLGAQTKPTTIQVYH